MKLDLFLVIGCLFVASFALAQDMSYVAELIKTQQYEKADQQIEHLLAKNPQNDVARFNLGVSQYLQKKFLQLAMCKVA